MGIVFGYLALVCFCMLAAKWIAKRCNLIKFDKVLTRIHKPVSLLLTVFCILHIVFVIPVLGNRNVLVNVSGVVAVIFMIVLFFSCHVLKQKDRRMKWHRILTMLMAVCIVWHVVVYFMDFREYQRNIESITFKNIELSEEMIKYKEAMENSNSVSVHIRRGDYLNPENQTIYGGICTEEYYEKAKALSGAKFRNLQFEKLLKYYRNK